MTISEIRSASGLSRSAFARKYAIPIRTLENWESGTNVCPEYTRRLLEDAVLREFPRE